MRARKKISFEEAPRFATEREWYVWVASLVEDERDYWYVKVIEEVDVEFVDVITKKDIKMRAEIDRQVFRKR